MFPGWRSRRATRRGGYRARRFWPRLEVLEDRCLLATLTVLNTSDSGAGSLRAAILQANSDPGPDTIVFDPSLAGQTIDLTTANTAPLIAANGEDFALGSSAFAITNAITIDGGSGGITLARDPNAPAFRLFQVYNPDDPAAASLTLKNVTVSGGLAQGGNGGNGGGGGGGAAGLGGAILNLGTLDVEGVTFTDNQAAGGNGGAGKIDPAVGSAGGGGGGAAGDGKSSAVLGVSNPNLLFQGGNGGAPNGGIGGFGPGAAGHDGGGGAGGSAFDRAPGGDAVSTLGLGGGGGGSGTGLFSSGGNGDFGGGGGGAGIGQLTAQPVAGGSSVFGGGSGGSAGGANAFQFAGGGGGGAGLGGANFSRGTLTIINSTFDGNSARGGLGGKDSAGNPSGGTGSGLGGAVFTWDSSATFINDTITENSVSTDFGGDIYNLQLAFNGLTPTATLDLVNNIVTEVENDGGTVTGSDNVVLVPRIPSSLIVSTADPLLGPLQDNGGPTPTMELLAGSPALNAGTPAGAPLTDQRGVLRGASINIGAYQASPAALTLTGFPTPTVAGTPGTFNVEASAVDVFGKTVFGYSGPVVFSATGQAIVPNPSPLNNGSGTFSATLFTPGPQTLTATDPLLNISGAQTVQVVPPPTPGQVRPPNTPTTPNTPTSPTTQATPTTPATPTTTPGVVVTPPSGGGTAAPAGPTITVTVAPPSVNSPGQQVITVTVSSSDSSEVAAAIILGRTGTMQVGSQGSVSQGTTGSIAVIVAVGITGNGGLISSAVGGPEVEADAKELADLEIVPRRGQETLLVVQTSFDASLGATSSAEGGGRGVPLTMSLTDANADEDAATPFSKILKSAAEGDVDLSLLLFRLEGKPLRIGSSLADADDSVLLVEVLVGPAGTTITEVPVVQAPATNSQRPPIVRAVAEQKEKPKDESPQSGPGMFSWAAGGLGVVVVIVVVWWWGWRPVSRPLDPTVR
jgi:hypothetical protein